ncbi:unnamed protein product [Nippostrongylus brasiliensis]|uniref:Reverse transcriptase domain-containing protein n=1 Tax=Nippostrongylus brasiliensis TaxID=27835 RepID=A0A0N4XHR5_NIPBR|nr:unnamed protein product [Nippostrongylus brasiliensis]
METRWWHIRAAPSPTTKHARQEILKCLTFAGIFVKAGAIVIRLIEVSREYKTPLYLTFIDIKKAFDSVETEAVIEALCKQGVPTQYVKILSELYKGFTTVITPLYNNVRINVKSGVRQGHPSSGTSCGH